MSFDFRQLRDLIIRSLKRRPGLYSDAALALLLGTAAAESGFGTYLRQRNGGPARGIFQMEPGTFAWLIGIYHNRFPELVGRRFEELEWDLDFAILMARLRYLAIPYPLPAADDLPALAAYWKIWYNSAAGRGTIERFIEAFRQYIPVGASGNLRTDPKPA